MDITGLTDEQIKEKVEKMFTLFNQCMKDLDGINGEVTCDDIEDIVKSNIKRITH